VLCSDPLADVGALGLVGVAAAGAAGAFCGAGAAGAFSAAGAAVVALDPPCLCCLLVAVVTFAGADATVGVLAADELDVAGLLLVPPHPAINSAIPTPPAASQAALLGPVRHASLLAANFLSRLADIATSSLLASIAKSSRSVSPGSLRPAHAEGACTIRDTAGPFNLLNRR
jgi:hypothetical protein